MMEAGNCGKRLPPGCALGFEAWTVYLEARAFQRKSREGQVLKDGTFIGHVVPICSSWIFPCKVFPNGVSSLPLHHTIRVRTLGILPSTPNPKGFRLTKRERETERAADSRQSNAHGEKEVAMEESPTTIMMGVNESTVKGYPHPSISSRNAFESVLKKLVRPSNSSLFKLVFLHVQVPDEDGFSDMDSIYASPQDFQDIKQRDKMRGLHLLQYFVSRCHELGISCEAWIKQGDPKEVICSEVKRVHPDILVVGSRGLGPFQRVFVGTVSEFCTKHAECPVIVIKRKADEAPNDPVDD